MMDAEQLESEKRKTVLAWHFLAGPLPGVLRDGRPAPSDGEILRHDGPLVLCNQGLHASVRAIGAVAYAPDSIVCRVECGGTIEGGYDKLVCTERKILWRADAEATLRAFARECALSVIHLWDPPAIVREYLVTGREEIRLAAMASAWGFWEPAWASGVCGNAARAARAAARATYVGAARAATGASWSAMDAAGEYDTDAKNVRLETMLLALAPAATTEGKA